MGRRDVRETRANDNLAEARKKHAGAVKKLSRTTRDSARGRDDALSAGQDIRDAARAADAAITDAEAYNSGVQDSKSYKLLQEAREFRASLDTPLVVTETLQRPTDKAQQQKLASRLKERGGRLTKEAAKDQVTDVLLTRLADYALGQGIANVVSIIHSVPLPPGTARWAKGALGEGAAYIGKKWQAANATTDPVTGNCSPRSGLCHNCRANARDGGIRTCQNHY